MAIHKILTLQTAKTVSSLINQNDLLQASCSQIEYRRDLLIAGVSGKLYDLLNTGRMTN